MSIPRNAEPGAFSGQQQVQEQPSINFASAIPIKKRRYPIFRPPSPSPEENISCSEDQESQIKKESKIPDEERPSLIDARNTSSPGNSDVRKTSASVVKKEVTPSSIELGQANVDIFASKPQESKATVRLNPVANLGNKLDISSKEKSSDREVKDSQTANVKQEVFGAQTEGTRGLELSMGAMSVELSLGPIEPIVPSLEHKKPEAICHRFDKSDPSLLSLALTDEKLVRIEKSDSTVDDVGSQVCANRSNWDLNTTMDVWEGSTNSDAFSHKLVDIVGGFGKMDSCHDEESSLTTAGTVGLSLNKRKHILDVCKSNSSNATIQPIQQCKTDVSLGLRLAMPHRELDARKEHFSLSDNLVSTSASPNFGLQRVQLSPMNVNRTVKSEPLDENSRYDCSVGISSSSNIGLLKLSSVKTEFVNNHSLETVLQSSVSPDKLVNCSISMKSEVVHKACKSEDGTLPQSVVRLMQHQESCASSSSSLLVPLMPQSSCSLIRLPTFSELVPSGNLSTHFQSSFHSKELHDSNDIPGEQIANVVSKPISQDDKQLRPSNIGNSSVVDPDKHKLARVDEDTVELYQHGKEAGDDDEKINISAEMIEEESFESDSGSQGNCAVDNLMDVEENIRNKEDEEYEDGEIREPLQCSGREEPIDGGNKTENLEFVECGSRNLQLCDLLGDQNISASDFDREDSVCEETYSDPNKDRMSITCTPNSEDKSLQKVSDKVLELGVDEKKTVSVTSDKRLNLSGKNDAEESPGKEISSDRPTNVNCGIGGELEDAATDKVVKEICPGENNSTLSKVEASLNGNEYAANDSSDAGNKSCIINLSLASVVASPCKTRSTTNRLLATRSGKERNSDLDGEIQPHGNRDEIYTGGRSNKFAKDRVHDRSLRNSRPNFMLGRGKISGRFGSFRGEWDSDHDFASETSYGPSDYRAVRPKRASDVEIECNGYNIQQDGTALGSNNRRKPTSDEFRRTSFTRFSPGDRDGPTNRGNQTLRRFPRNISPNRSNGEDTIELRHGDKFMRHLSDDIMNPVYNHPPQAMYDELDGQLVRGNQNFSTMQRKGYPRNRSKSPVRSRTRSPGPWSSPQHRSPAFYRMGRMRSPDRVCFRDEMVSRRRGSPSYIARHSNDLRDVDSGREHVHHPRSANSNMRSSPERVFLRSGRRTNSLDSDGDEYTNGPNKFHELRGDGSIDERRKFVESHRPGPRPVRSFRPSYNDDGENFRFHPNDGPRPPPYRFCPDGDTEFVERGNVREREFDGRMKHHQPLIVSRRVRNVDEQQDGNYRPVERVWHGDGFADGRVKRRRF